MYFTLPTPKQACSDFPKQQIRSSAARKATPSHPSKQAAGRGALPAARVGRRGPSARKAKGNPLGSISRESQRGSPLDFETSQNMKIKTHGKGAKLVGGFVKGSQTKAPMLRGSIWARAPPQMIMGQRWLATDWILCFVFFFWVFFWGGSFTTLGSKRKIHPWARKKRRTIPRLLLPKSLALGKSSRLSAHPGRQVSTRIPILRCPHEINSRSPLGT